MIIVGDGWVPRTSLTGYTFKYCIVNEYCRGWLGTQGQPNKLRFEVLFIMTVADDDQSIKGT